MKNAFYLVVGVLLVLLSVYLFVMGPAPERFGDTPYAAEPSLEAELEQRTLRIGETSLLVEVLDTLESRVQGLSGRETLPDGLGLYFVFDEADMHGIWMKDMNFSIDIAWINEKDRIIHIEESVSPDTYPQVFQPSEPALYVLEVPAGFFARNSIGVGEEALLSR